MLSYHYVFKFSVHMLLLQINKLKLKRGYVWVARANGRHEILFMSRERPRNDGDE